MNKKIIFRNSKKTVSDSTEKLIQEYSEIIENQPKQVINPIRVDEIASKIAVFYEKIREIIDWKEEHLLRRAAIERVLKRRFMPEISGLKALVNFDPEKMAEPFVRELIRGGHFPNHIIPKQKIKKVAVILNKYITILQVNVGQNSTNIKKKVNFYNWVLEIAACEIEETLRPAKKENLIIDFMTQEIVKRVKLASQIKMSEQEKIIQTYIAVHRTLFNLDAPIISYHLLKIYYHNWKNTKKHEETANRIKKLHQQIDNDLNHPLGGKFRKICEKYDTVYLIINDTLAEIAKTNKSLSAIFNSKEKLGKIIKKVYDRRLSSLKARLLRAALYSTLSILVASGVSLFIVEIPLAKLFYGHFSLLGITTDILLPTVVMFLLVIIIRPPKEDNYQRVLEEIQKIIYPRGKQDIYEINIRKRKVVPQIIIGFLYTLTSLGSIALIFWLFYLAHIPFTSLILDTLNVAMIVFAALIIRQRAKEITIDEKTGFLQFLLDILSVPVAKLGQWLSKKWREYNVVSVFLTALIDTPLTSLIEFVESWNSFLKEKKAEIN